MADPLGLIGLGITGLQTLFGVSAAQKEAAANKRQAVLTRFFARKRAADALARGGNAAAQALGESSRIVGEQRAEFGGRNLKIGEGTARQITDATDLLGSIDALTIRMNARREAEGALVEAVTAEENMKLGAKGQVAGTILGGAGQFSSQLRNLLRAE